MHYVHKNTLFLAWLPDYQRIQKKIIDVITARLLLTFLKTLNFQKIYNPICYTAKHAAVIDE